MIIWAGSARTATRHYAFCSNGDRARSGNGASGAIAHVQPLDSFGWFTRAELSAGPRSATNQADRACCCPARAARVMVRERGPSARPGPKGEGGQAADGERRAEHRTSGSPPRNRQSKCARGYRPGADSNMFDDGCPQRRNSTAIESDHGSRMFFFLGFAKSGTVGLVGLFPY